METHLSLQINYISKLDKFQDGRKSPRVCGFESGLHLAMRGPHVIERRDHVFMFKLQLEYSLLV